MSKDKTKKRIKLREKEVAQPTEETQPTEQQLDQLINQLSSQIDKSLLEKNDEQLQNNLNNILDNLLQQEIQTPQQAPTTAVAPRSNIISRPTDLTKFRNEVDRLSNIENLKIKKLSTAQPQVIVEKSTTSNVTLTLIGVAIGVGVILLFFIIRYFCCCKK